MVLLKGSPMDLRLVCFVHPIDVDAHPSVLPGHRWAVMMGIGAPSDLPRCANAGWAPDAKSAEAEGDQNLATAVRVLQFYGLPAEYGGVIHLDQDPIPAGADRVSFI